VEDRPRAAGGGARRALVTGASSGIGEATARHLAGQGYAVALLARRAAELERVLAALPHRDRHLALPCDVRDPPAIDAALARLAGSWDALDLLVHGAGVGCLATLERTEPANVRAVLETNVAGVLDLSRAALPLLRRGSRPVVVLVSSIVGRRGIPGQIVYSASKAALNSIGEGLRVEWAEHDVAVCTLDVGLTRTPFFSTQANPAGLPGPNLAGAAEPDEVAREIVELDRRPRPERWLSSKWRWLALAGVVAPRLADRVLVRRLGGSWRLPRR
jgi:NAD(P)-dependent dehydrogenase (short-subunit alcohol dehydrogenase family)